MNYLEKLSEKCLEEYDTSFEEDMEILETKESELSYNASNCIKLRAGEKEVLREIIKFCQSVKKLINFTPQVTFFILILGNSVDDRALSI